MIQYRAPSFTGDGAQLFPAALDAADLAALEAALGDPPEAAGLRLSGNPILSALLAADAPIGAVAAAALGPRCFPVRALLFDKTATTNWALGWHQDRTIVVRERRDVAGYGPWTIKRGMIHVAPPVDLLSRMVTVRVHLDPVGPDNAPLLIALDTHRRGMVPEGDLEAVVAGAERHMCLAARGDIWLTATLVLHASDAARAPSRRRVLQIDYAAEPLPGGLDWLGI